MGWLTVIGAAAGYLFSDDPEEQKATAAEETAERTATERYVQAVEQQKGLISPLMDTTKKDVASLLTSQARATSAEYAKDNIDKAATPFGVADTYSKANRNLTSASNTATSLARSNKFARKLNATSMGKGFGATSSNSLMDLTRIANEQSRIDQNTSLRDSKYQGEAFRQLAGFVGDKYSGSFSGGGSNMNGQAGYTPSKDRVA